MLNAIFCEKFIDSDLRKKKERKKWQHTWWNYPIRVDAMQNLMVYAKKPTISSTCFANVQER